MSFINLASASSLLIYELGIYAPVRINQTPTLAFLDTGSNNVSISPKLAERFPRTGTIVSGSAFAWKTFDVVEDVDVEFLGRTSKTHARIYQPPSNPPFDTDVTLNASIIYGQPVIFDFRLLYLASPQQIFIQSWNEVEAIYLEKIDLCLFTMQFFNRPVIALFDTGAGISAVNTAHLNELHLNLKPAFELEVGDATGEKVTQSIVRCSNLSINGILLPPFDCLQSDFQSIENAIGHRIDLIFGANILLKSGLRWLFDKPAGKVFIAE